MTGGASKIFVLADLVVIDIPVEAHDLIAVGSPKVAREFVVARNLLEVRKGLTCGGLLGPLRRLLGHGRDLQRADRDRFSAGRLLAPANVSASVVVPTIAGLPGHRTTSAAGTAAICHLRDYEDEDAGQADDDRRD
jgi:hypothetical protein